MKPADRCRHITPFIVMEILEKIHQMEARGIDVVHMEIGEPDFPVPECVKSASLKAFSDNQTSYTHSLGDIGLRETICRYHEQNYGTVFDPGQVIVTSGTSPAMLLLFSALINPGDEVIVSDPHYACYANFIQYVQGVPVLVPVVEEEGFVFTPEAIEKKITPKTRAIFINSPSNPTGQVIPDERFKEIAAIAKKHQLYLISDEIYHGLVYEGKAHSVFEYTDQAFLLNGFSKLFAMTGLRLGYLVAPHAFIRPLQILQQNFFICANSVAQISGIAALKHAGEVIPDMVAVYDQRRRFVLKRLKEMGFSIPVDPTGAFYVFVNAQHLSADSYGLALDILEKAHLGVTPGIDFGSRGEGYLRFSYANSMENIEKGLNRLERYLNQL